jgi:bacterial/archaeal transporter family-2 protein
LGLMALHGAAFWQVPRTAVTFALVSGTLGVFIILGVSYSMAAIGVTAGFAALILGQMVISTAADTTGWGGIEPIPLSLSRIAGLALLLVAVVLLLPRR